MGRRRDGWADRGATGFRFSLKVAETLVPVTGASIEFLPSGKVFDEVSDNGMLLVYLPALKRGEKYSYLLTAPGFAEMAGELVAHTGVMHRVNLILTPEVMSVEGASVNVKVS